MIILRIEGNNPHLAIPSAHWAMSAAGPCTFAVHLYMCRHVYLVTVHPMHLCSNTWTGHHPVTGIAPLLVMMATTSTWCLNWNARFMEVTKQSRNSKGICDSLLYNEIRESPKFLLPAVDYKAWSVLPNTLNPSCPASHIWCRRHPTQLPTGTMNGKGMPCCPPGDVLKP